jgi:hypothetical protein
MSSSGSSPTLPKQFIISSSRHQTPHDWLRTLANGLFIERSPDVPLVSVYIGSTRVAWFLGWFSDGARFFATDHSVHLDNLQDIDALTERAAGRFVVVRPCADGISVRTDAVGLLPVVVDLLHRTVASSPAALALAYPQAVSNERRDAVVRADKTTWYPFGLTPYANVERLLPNQHVVLPDGAIYTTPRRAMSSTAHAGRVTASIFATTVGHIRALAAAGPIDAHLTAGYDSRMVLAATIAANVASDLVTFSLPNGVSGLDISTATRLASIANLKHRIVLFSSVSVAERQDWLWRTGNCVDDTVTDLCTTVRLNDTGRFTLTGSVGEVGRAFYWQHGDMDAESISAAELIDRLGFRASRLLMDRADRWLTSFSGSFQRPDILDWAYIDHRLCGWAGPSSVGHLVDKPTISPFNSNYTLSQMLSLPYDYRYLGSFSEAFIRLGSADLLSLPFNRGVGLRRLRHPRAELKALLPKPAIAKLKRLFR